MTHEHVCQQLGAHPREIVRFEETDAGVVVDHQDGTQYIIVPPDKPDAGGRTGVLRYGRWPATFTGQMGLYERQPGQ
ncbi:MAG TPA: hypothetical protein VII76_05655 [Acidimicrobiales bacterium]